MAAISTNGLADDPRSRVAAVVQRHERMLLRVARQASLCHDDALDAYQRALEIFVRRVETVDPATEVAWLKVVVRHEAMAIRRARSESVTGEELDFDAFLPAVGRTVDEEIAATERVRRSAEALRALKPDEAKALMMKANGLSYDEISERNGWSYTKVNRAITEGRRRFLAVFEGIESGEECERFAPVVEALALGTATARQIVSIRPHLRHCGACRAAIRDLHVSRTRRLGLFWPGFLLAAESTRDEQERLLHTLAESGTPVESAGRLADLKQRILEFFHRAQASDVATGVQIAATGGGGRLASVAALVGICLTGALGASTVCVVTGVVSDPFGLLVDKAPQLARPHPRATVRPKPTPAPTPPPLLTARPTATSTPAPRRTSRPARKRPASRDRSQRTERTSHENAPITPALASSTGQESFSPETPTGPTQPASAPATGGDEFTP
ncbi:MAG TPA: sigma-70 family RNA polymerase sigma factor [Solirubrobacteraceae bacterium]|nr:sigma-70 family RNA polymerase sigma factor [Solirubrobacteraceae bacterium]